MMMVQEIQTGTLPLAKASGSFSQQRSEVVLKSTCHSFQGWLMGCISKMAGQGLNPPVTWCPQNFLILVYLFVYLFIFAEFTDRVYA